MRPISAQVKRDIIAEANKGISNRAIALKLDVGYGTVQRVVNGAGIDPKRAKAGRVRKISPHLRRLAVRSITSGKVDTAVDVKRMLVASHGVEVSVQTVRNELRASGLKARPKVKKPLLTKRFRQARLRFAKKYQHWTVEDWRRVIFSDETKVNRLGSDGRKWIWKEPGEQLQDRYVSPTVKHGGGSMMVWGCITAHGVGDLVRIVGTLNAQLYVDILRDDLLRTLSYYNIEKPDIVFQHDNDPKHTARITTEWLENEGVEVLDWPSQSPDLNPIEHIWSWFKQRLADQDEPAPSIHELWLRAERVWEKFTKVECQRLIDTMPQRIAAVIAAKGGNTNY
jgi:transposase